MGLREELEDVFREGGQGGKEKSASEKALLGLRHMAAPPLARLGQSTELLNGLALDDLLLMGSALQDISKEKQAAAAGEEEDEIENLSDAEVALETLGGQVAAHAYTQEKIKIAYCVQRNICPVCAKNRVGESNIYCGDCVQEINGQ